ncbi:hypothetical protein [Sunxiuqinia sp. sy24]|uniref:hypothetical protein n=1 Tax=Sunxiuqinia sp. sy24 TaxID=3461495 RepID=UPI0040457017
MDLTPLNTISSSDNFFKFITLSGIIICLIALFYPTHMQNQLELDKLKFEQDSLLLNLEAKLTTKEIYHLSADIDSSKLEFKSLRKKGNHEADIINIKNKIEKKYELLSPKKKIILTKSTIQSYNRKKIQLIQSQINKYRSYKTWMLIISFIFIIGGGLFWAKSQFVSEKIKKKQL